MAQHQWLFLYWMIIADTYVMAAEHPSSAPIPSTTRKLGKDHFSESKSSNAPALSPSSAPAAPGNQAPETEESLSLLVQEIHLKKHHHSVDRSVAGGGVILGGLATTFLVAVFCYIRATARHKAVTNNASTGAQIGS